MSSFYIISTTNTNDKWIKTDNTYILQKRIRAIIRDEYNNQYQIILDKGYRCDGLSVPKVFQWYLPSWDKDNQLYNLARSDTRFFIYTQRSESLYQRRM